MLWCCCEIVMSTARNKNAFCTYVKCASPQHVYKLAIEMFFTLCHLDYIARCEIGFEFLISIDCEIPFFSCLYFLSYFHLIPEILNNAIPKIFPRLLCYHKICVIKLTDIFLFFFDALNTVTIDKTNVFIVIKMVSTEKCLKII